MPHEEYLSFYEGQDTFRIRPADRPWLLGQDQYSDSTQVEIPPFVDPWQGGRSNGVARARSYEWAMLYHLNPCVGEWWVLQDDFHTSNADLGVRQPFPDTRSLSALTYWPEDYGSRVVYIYSINASTMVTHERGQFARPTHAVNVDLYVRNAESPDYSTFSDVVLPSYLLRKANEQEIAMARTRNGYAYRLPSYLRRPPEGEQSGPTDYLGPDEDDTHSCDDDCYDYGCSYSGDEDDSYLIRDYSYRPKPLFHGQDSPVYLGVELELQVPYSTENQAMEAINSGWPVETYFKRDGSIEENGIEVVTHPMTYQYARGMNIVGVFNQLRELEASPHRSCGMHVHVSRKAFDGAGHTYRWLKFMFRNRDLVQKVARRESGQWAAFDNATQIRDHKHYAKGAWGGHERYSAVNGCNPHTFEVRVFASTLNPRKFLAALGLVDSTVEYTRQLKIADINANKGWGSNAYLRWLTKPGNEKRYEPLIAELTRLEVMTSVYADVLS